MAKFTDVEDVVESGSERKIRIFLAVLFFFQTVITTLPFMQGYIDEIEDYRIISGFGLLVQPNGYGQIGAIGMLVMGIILVVVPIIAFFFFVFDKKSKIKYLIGLISCVSSAIVITFGIGLYIAFGAVVTLVLNVLELFMISMGFQATRIREHTM